MPSPRVNSPLKLALAGSLVLEAAKALINRDCWGIDGPNIILECADHAEAIRLVTNLRDAIAQAEAA